MQRVLLCMSLVFCLLCVFPSFTTASDAPAGPARIVGGEVAPDGAWPWMVALVNPSSPNPFQGQFCGASLIADDWVLTAAHCVTDFLGDSIEPGSVLVYIGMNELSEATNANRFFVDRVIAHEDFDPATLDNDIALLRLEDANGTVPTIQVVGQFDPNNLVLPGSFGTAIGWGNTSSTDVDYPNSLMQVDLPVVTQQALKDAYEPMGLVVTDAMFGAGFDEGGKDACQGDSGGPFMQQNSFGAWIQTGITSWGIGCAEPNQYGVYTRLSDFSEWIDSRMDDGGGGGGGGCVASRTAAGLELVLLLCAAGVLLALRSRAMRQDG